MKNNSCLLLEMQLIPIHEATSPTTAKIEEPLGQEFDVVCYNETPHPNNDASTTQLLSLCSDTELAKDSSDSGVGHVDLDNGIASSSSPPNTCKNQSVSFFT